MLRLLRAAGLVQSARGQLGRYKLARLPEQIQISEILITLGGQLFGPRFCRRHAGAASCCSHSSECSIRILRPNIQAAVNRISDHLSLEDLLGTEATLHQHLARVWAPWQQSTD